MKAVFAESLLPVPRFIRRRTGRHRLAKSTGGPLIERIIISIPAHLTESVSELQRIAGFVLGRRQSQIVKWHIRQRQGKARPQEHRLRISADHVWVQADDVAGFRHAFQTLRQLLDADETYIPNVEIHDWPDFPVRGVMLDISRDKVPTMETLRRLVRKFAGWKLNQLQLYTEHTFAYRGHERVWRGASPMTAAQIRSLDRYCRLHGIELVPNQNSFGHMERWLRHEPYRRLAETTGPWRMKSGTVRSVSATLNPLDPGSIRLVADLYDQLLPNFASRLFNVGCDETFELGQGKSRAACQRRGLGNVYVDFLLKIYREVRRRDRRMMFWSDIIHEHPRTIARLPKDALALVWGYEAEHPFAKQCDELRRAGLAFYVCPGTSSWCSFAGRTENCLGNLLMAARAGRRRGATGYLITDWGDYGHRQYLPVSYAGFLYGASVAWCVERNQTPRLVAAVARHALAGGNPRLANLWLEIGRVPVRSRVKLKNRTILFSVMEEQIENMPALSRISAGVLKNLHRWLIGLQRRLPAATQRGDTEGALEILELRTTVRVLLHAVRRAQLAIALQQRRDVSSMAAKLAPDMRAIMTAHRTLWLARNRAGGLDSSLGYFEKNLAEYERLAGRSRPGARGHNLISTME